VFVISLLGRYQKLLVVESADDESKEKVLVVVVLTILNRLLLCLCDAEFTLSFLDFSRFVCA